MVDRTKKYRAKVDIFYITKDDLTDGVLIASAKELFIIVSSNTILTWNEDENAWVDEDDDGYLGDWEVEEYCEPINYENQRQN